LALTVRDHLVSAAIDANKINKLNTLPLFNMCVFCPKLEKYHNNFNKFNWMLNLMAVTQSVGTINNATTTWHYESGEAQAMLRTAELPNG